MSEPKPSCESCFFNVSAQEQVSKIRQSVGTPLCAKGFGPTSLISANASQQARIEEAKAKDCGSYEPRAADGSRPSQVLLTKEGGSFPIVMLPDPEVLTSDDGPAAVSAASGMVTSTISATPGMVTSCLQCANFVPPDQVFEAGLWNVGVCRARGIMITNTSVTAAANDCSYKRIGPRDSTAALMRMTLSPEYSAGMNIGTVPSGGIVMEESHEIVEPTTYETDRPVEKADAELGIRAWRKVEDENAEAAVYLPIYDVEFFSEEERAAIPRTGDDEHPEQYVDHLGLVYKAAVLWMHLDETPALWGVAGTGKTEFYRHMAWLMCLPFQRISITASTEVEDLAGKMHFEPSRGTYFEYGRIPKAWQKPGIICLDEPNVGPPDVWQFIRPLTDNSKQLVLDMNNGERVARHVSAFLGLAMNPAWDVRNVGTGMLADADGSRLMHIYVELPDEETERRIIKDRCKLDGYDIPPEKLEAVMKIAKDLRALCEEDTLPITWGIRPQIKVARALRWFSMPQAYRLATADYLEPEHQQLILDAVKTHTPPSKPAPRPITRAR